MRWHTRTWPGSRIPDLISIAAYCSWRRGGWATVGHATYVDQSDFLLKVEFGSTTSWILFVCLFHDLMWSNHPVLKSSIERNILQTSFRQLFQSLYEKPLKLYWLATLLLLCAVQHRRLEKREGTIFLIIDFIMTDDGQYEISYWHNTTAPAQPAKAKILLRPCWIVHFWWIGR